MNPDETIVWSALEYEEKEHNTDWFWALGVIIVAGSITAIIFKNYFFAVLLILSGALMGFFSIKKPEMVAYELNEKGLKIKTRLYPFEEIKAFWVQKEGEPKIFIKSKRLIMPIFYMPIEPALVNKIHDKMLAKNVPEEKMNEHISEKIMESMGF